MPDDVVTDTGDLAEDTGDILSALNAGLDKGGGQADETGGETGGESGKGLNLEDVLPPEKPESKPEGEEVAPKPKEKEEEEEEEEEEDEDLLESEDEEELGREGELQVIKDIEKAHPKFFKQFKGVKLSLLRDAAFSRTFSSPKEANEIAQLNDDYREFEQELLAGNHAKVLKAIRDTNESGYKRFVTGIMPTLAEHDPNTYTEISAPILAGMLRRVAETGIARGDKNLVNSAKHIASLLWPTYKGEIPELAVGTAKSSPEMDERQRQLEEKEKSLDQRDAQQFVGAVKSTCNRLLRKRVEKGLDPNSVLSPFVKNSVVEKAMQEVQELLNEDLRFNRVMEQTFARAKRSGYSGEYRTRMVGTYIGRATQLIGPIRRRLILAALNKSDGKGDKETKPPVRREVGEGGTSGSQQRIAKTSDINWDQTSDLDILSNKVKSKRAPIKG